MAMNHLLILLPQFRTIEVELDHAVETDDRNHAARTLVTYRHTAIEVAALLSLDDSSKTVSDLLKTSAMTAATTKGELVTKKGRSLRSILQGFQMELAQVLSEVGSVTSTMRIEGGR